MLSWLRRLFAPSLADLETRVTRLELSRAEWETDLTSLTDKLSSQLKRMRQRHVSAEPEKTREELLNDAIRARRRSRAFPLTNGDDS